MSQLPNTHPHVFSLLLSCCSPSTLSSVQLVCHSWTYSISSDSSLWPCALRSIAGRAKRLAWAVRHDLNTLGKGWQGDKGAEYLVQVLEHLALTGRTAAREAGKKMCKKLALRLEVLVQEVEGLIQSEVWVGKISTILEREANRSSAHLVPGVHQISLQYFSVF